MTMGDITEQEPILRNYLEEDVSLIVHYLRKMFIMCLAHRLRLFLGLQ